MGALTNLLNFTRIKVLEHLQLWCPMWSRTWRWETSSGHQRIIFVPTSQANQALLLYLFVFLCLIFIFQLLSCQPACLYRKVSRAVHWKHIWPSHRFSSFCHVFWCVSLKMEDPNRILSYMAGLCHRASHSGHNVYTLRPRAYGNRRSE